MQFSRALTGTVIHSQAVQVQITHIAVGSEHIVVIADRAMGISIKVTSLVGACSIYIGIAATQLATSFNVAIMGAVVAHTGQVDGGIGPCRTTVGKVKAMSTGFDACGEVLHVIVRQERFDREVIERGIHVIVLAADIIVAVTAHRTTTSRDAQVASHPSATLLAQFAAHLHGRQFHVLESQHLVQHAGVTQVHLGIEVGLHAVHVGGVVDSSLALDASHARHIGIQRVDIETLVVSTSLGFDLHWLVVRDVLQCLFSLWDKFLHLIEVDFAVGIDGGFAVGLAIEHILIHMGVKLDVTALGLEFHVIEVKTVLVLVDGAAGILYLQATAFLAAQVFDRHLHVLAVILKVIDGGIEVLHLNIVRVKRRTRLVGFLACLSITALTVVDTHLVSLYFPRLVIIL